MTVELVGRVDAFNGVPVHVKSSRCLTPRKHAAMFGASLLMSDVPNGLEMKLSKGKNKKVIVLGGDGFCGWPTSLHLSQSGDLCSVRGFLSSLCVSLWSVVVLEGG